MVWDPRSLAFGRFGFRAKLTDRTGTFDADAWRNAQLASANQLILTASHCVRACWLRASWLVPVSVSRATSGHLPTGGNHADERSYDLERFYVAASSATSGAYASAAFEPKAK
jgi:hypothetical protein